MKPGKNVAVIGAGLSGLLMIKSLKEEHINCVCFEKSSNIGGTWYFNEDDIRPGFSPASSAIISNHSKVMDALSDHLWPEESAMFMPKRQLYQNILEFATKFDLLKYVRYNFEVVSVMKANDYLDTGQWVVKVKDVKANNNNISYVFDGVMLCTGQTVHPSVLQANAIQMFQGRKIHIHQIKTFQEFAGQNVVIVGTNNESIRAAEQISQLSRKVYISCNRHPWLIRRLCHKGLPYDFLLFRRCFLFLLNMVKTEHIKYLSKIVERHICNFMFSHKFNGIHPTQPVMCQELIVNNDISNKLMSEAVIFRNDIREVGMDTVTFQGDAEPTKIDTIVLSTEYTYKFDYLEKGILVEQEEDNIQLYKLMYPPHLEHPTLAFIGVFSSWGPSLGLCELQTRWAASLLNNNVSLPNMKSRFQDIQSRYKYNSQRYKSSNMTSLHVDCMKYADDIASQIGVLPNLFRMVFTDPRLFICCFLGPFLFHQYRLQGPHKWDEARHAILEMPERLSKARKCERKSISNIAIANFVLNALIMIVLVVLPYILIYSSILYIMAYIGFIYLVLANKLALKYGFVVFQNPAYVLGTMLIWIFFLLFSCESVFNITFDV